MLVTHHFSTYPDVDYAPTGVYQYDDRGWGSPLDSSQVTGPDICVSLPPQRMISSHPILMSC